MRKFVLLVLVILWVASGSWGLEKDEILVVYNRSFAGSKKLADYYVAKRGIPEAHVLGIRTDRKERVPRAVYVETIEPPIKAWMDKDGHRDKIKCILLMRGIPLALDRVYDEKTHKPYNEAARALRPVEREKTKLVDEKKRLEAEAKKYPARGRTIDRQLRGLEAKTVEVDIRMKPLKDKRDRACKAWDLVTKDTNASVDSELAVMYVANNRLKRWLPNALHYLTWNRPGRDRLPKTFMVCRLDGGSGALVKRIIDDSIAVEKTGLKGIAYFDARGLRIRPEGRISAYAAYDERIRRAAAMVEKTGMKTVFDDQSALFLENACPNTALYCGWYRLANYVPAFQWNRGSVGFHIASAEATHLRTEKTQVWCKRMIDEGIAATLGPVWEPYLQSFPDPKPFFAFLLTGKYTVLEAFWYSKPMNSWQLTLIADPLYTPFKQNPKMTIAELKEALKPTPLRPTTPRPHAGRTP